MKLEYFFTYETEIPDGIGFEAGGAEHILWLAALTAAAVLLLRLYLRLGEAGRRMWEYAVAFSLPVWIAVRLFYIAILREDFLYELPLHLCSIAGILCALHAVTHWEWVGQVLYAEGLPGAAFALLFPNWGMYPAVHFISIEGFLFHAGIILYVAGRLVSRGIVPRLGKLWQALVFLAVFVAPVYCFDKRWHVNYLFVNWPSAGSPLELLAERFGNPGYLVWYGLLVVLCMFFMVLGYELWHHLFLEHIRRQ